MGNLLPALPLFLEGGMSSGTVTRAKPSRLVSPIGKATFGGKTAFSGKTIDQFSRKRRLTSFHKILKLRLKAL